MKKNNLVALIVLIVLVIVFVVSRSIRDYSERRVEFFQYSLEHLHSFELESNTDTLRFQKDEVGLWHITYPVNYPAAEHRIDFFFDNVLTVETSVISATDRPDSFDRFGLTERDGRLIRLLNSNNQVIDEAVIGRRGQNTFARKINQNEVFQLSSNIFHNVIVDLNTWRNNNILNLNKDFIDSIEVQYRQNSYTLTQIDQLWYYIDDDHNFMIQDDNTVLNQILSSFASLRVSDFIDYKYDKYEMFFLDPEVVINVQTEDNRFHNLVIIATDEDTFLLMKDDQKDHLYQISSHWINRFTKSYMHFEE